ncbi:MAG TPA: alpha/beta fold hydrolase, partial [Anaerolineales bacterium]|nr:alpha/beta fold hydrolase [Anaerolineales bacterium]
MLIRDISLYVKVTGHGEPLLLIHGGPGLDHTSLLPLAPLADRYTLIFYDQRCNGRSVGPDVASMTWENLTADAEALREILGFDRWAVLGHSFGGHVALEYALRHPESISRLILMDTAGESRWSMENAPQLLARRGYRPAAVNAVRRFFNGQVTPAEFVPTVMQFFTAYYAKFSPLTLAHDLFSGRKMVMQPEAQISFCRDTFPG